MQEVPLSRVSAALSALSATEFRTYLAVSAVVLVLSPYAVPGSPTASAVPPCALKAMLVSAMFVEDVLSLVAAYLEVASAHVKASVTELLDASVVFSATVVVCVMDFVLLLEVGWRVFVGSVVIALACLEFQSCLEDA